MHFVTVNIFLDEKLIITQCFASEYFQLKGEKVISEEHIFIFQCFKFFIKILIELHSQ